MSDFFPNPPGSGRDATLLIAHRGGAHFRVAENSKEAISKSVALGISHVEVDVRRTRDGALVLAHGPTQGFCPIAAVSLEQLLKINPSLYTLEQLLIDFPSIFVRLDLKTRGAARLAAEVTIDHVERINFSGFFGYRINAAASISPAASRSLGVLRGQELLFRAITGLKFPNISQPLIYNAPNFLVRFGWFRHVVVPVLHHNNVYVLAWTVNDPQEAAAWIDAGVDAILTNYPVELEKVVSRRSKQT